MAVWRVKGDGVLMDFPAAGVFLPWWEVFPSKEVGNGGVGGWYFVCVPPAPTALFLDTPETARPLTHPLGTAWFPDSRNGLIQPGGNHGMTGDIIKILFRSQSAECTV